MSVAPALKNLFAGPYAPVSAADAIAMAKAGHAPKARHIPLDQLARRAGELPNGRTVVTVCRSGARAGLPVVAKGGGPGRIA